MRTNWTGWDADGALLLQRADGTTERLWPRATLLALGGASWPRLGADGSWVPVLRAAEVSVADLRPANMGFCVEWPEAFRAKAAGQPLKPVTLHFGAAVKRGELMITDRGIEGGAVYALSSVLREALARDGTATLGLDLRPDLSVGQLTERLRAPRGSQSFSTYLRKAAGLGPVAIGVLRVCAAESLAAGVPVEKLAAVIKTCPLRLTAPFPLARAISSAGGVTLDAVDASGMLRARAGVFVAGEMMDWEAPTGGYLLQACFATGARAARGVQAWL